MRFDYGDSEMRRTGKIVIRTMTIFYVPGAVLFAFQMLSCLILTTLSNESYSRRENKS